MANQANGNRFDPIRRWVPQGIGPELIAKAVVHFAVGVFTSAAGPHAGMVWPTERIVSDTLPARTCRWGVLWGRRGVCSGGKDLKDWNGVLAIGQEGVKTAFAAELFPVGPDQWASILCWVQERRHIGRHPG